MTMDPNHIKKITHDFIYESIRDQNPAGLCFSTSCLLHLYLATKQIKSHLVKGEVPKLEADGTIKNCPHYWLQIDSTETIIDATIQQFKNPDPIYVGRLQDNEITRTFIPSKLEFQAWFTTDFDGWKYFYEQAEYPLPPLDGPFEKRSITYTIKLASILHAECKKLTAIDPFINHHFGIYFKPVYLFLNNWHKGKIKFEIKKESMPVGFDDLLSDVLKWESSESKKN